MRSSLKKWGPILLTLAAVAFVLLSALGVSYLLYLPYYEDIGQPESTILGLIALLLALYLFIKIARTILHPPR